MTNNGRRDREFMSSPHSARKYPLDMAKNTTITRSAAERPSAFMIYNAAWTSSVFTPVRLFYDSFHAFVGSFGPLGTSLLKGHYVFFVTAVAGLVFLFPRYMLFWQWGIKHYLLEMNVALPDTSPVPYTPNDLMGFLLIFLATFFFKDRLREACLLVCSFPIGYLLERRIDLPSLALMGAFAGLAFFLIRLHFRRMVAVALMCILSITLMVVCAMVKPVNSWLILTVALYQPLLLPSLWYSVYEETPPRKRLHPLRFLTYLYLRFFLAPVATYREIFLKDGQGLDTIHFAGIKALYVVLYATVARWAIGEFLARFDDTCISGFPLIFFSYLYYIDFCCEIVILFNIPIGVLRLFGIPIRDNFNYWLLARTPNEHWRRWNLLLREWIVTYVFFPIMRAKRWLFAAVMVTLGTSGILHVLPLLLPQKFDLYRITIVMVYWLINGLAIYAVIKIPLLAPVAVKRLRIGASRAWDIVGIILTSLFYSVLTYSRSNTHNWNELADYFCRIFQFTKGGV